MKICCRTLFDITSTGIVGHYRSSRVPFTDGSGQSIVNEADWQRARNQQRNWETITQIASLRTQIDVIQPPGVVNGAWQFEFQVDSDSLFSIDSDSLAVLKNDCDAVPMITGLNEKETAGEFLQPNVNIWFEVLPINS